jgi:hypothetical protein
MGTGSYGGGGGGSATSGGVGRSGGEYRSRDGKLVGGTVSNTAMAKHVRVVLGSIPKEYLTKYISSSLAQSIYKELFNLHVDLVTNHSWSGIERRLGVPDGPGCLIGVAHALIARYGSEEGDLRVKETMSNVVEDFLMRVVEDDPDILLSGSATEVLEAVNPQVFRSTAGYFLTFVILRMLEREHERLPAQGQSQLRAIAEELANRIWARFDRDYRDKPFGDRAQTTAGDLLNVLSATDWFTEELRK